MGRRGTGITRILVVAAAAALGPLGCGPSARAKAAVEPPKTVGAPAPPAQADDAPTVAVAAGVATLGSLPGTRQRNPRDEADLVAVALPAFEIDRLPFPNEPGKPARTGVDRAEAEALCAGAGKQLCSELQWERACKGSDGGPYTTGAELDLAACRSAPERCGSREGVLGLGVALREWTASSAAQGIGHALRTAVVRGAPFDAALPAHRCAARTGATPDTRAPDLGFRCCRGSAGDASYPVEPERPLTRPLTLDVTAARAALLAVPELAAFATSFEPFTDKDVDAALRRGGASRTGIALWTFQAPLFAWSPTRGEELYVLSGRTTQGALLALIYAYGEGHFAHAASTLIAEAGATVAVGVNADHPDQLIFSTCYGCAGEGGTIRFGDDARVELGFR